MERLSTHPLARAITRYGKQQGFTGVDLERFESVTGHGLRARRGGLECLLGKRDWVVSLAGDNFARRAPDVDAGLSEIWLSYGELAGRLILRDDVRPEARRVIDQLRGEGLETVVLTGDRKETGNHLRNELHLSDVRSELKPEEKLSQIGEMTRQGKLVAMVGDGVNDAPSLAAAHIGVAMGARGSDAALEQADVVLMHDRLENFLAAFRLSQRARSIIRQNLVISLGTVVVLVTLALLGRIPLTIGVVGHEGSTVLVVMNSLRLLIGRVGPREA
jgi:Cd2+/Zn2+-exporting ATPase